eukprot:g1001.t1
MPKAMKHDLRGMRIYATQNVVEYRQAIDSLVCEGDVALEVGCAGGLTTKRLAQACALAVGIDKNETPVCKSKQAELASERLRFATVDAFDVASIKRLEAGLPRPFSVIFIDLSGNRELATMMTLITTYEKMFAECRFFCVKNYKLVKLIANSSTLSSAASAAAAPRFTPTAAAVAAASFATGLSLGALMLSVLLRRSSLK